MTEAIEIKLSHIILRDELRPRDVIDDSIVDEYRENITDLPPILVAIDNAHHILIDGWHRYHAHRDARRDTIMAIVDPEIKPEDFFFTAVRANKAHGIRFDASEKKKISKRLFIQENRSAAEISQAIGCSLRHATDLIKDLAHEKKQIAMQLAKDWQDRLTTREIAAGLKALGHKTSKSAVSRWLQKSHVVVPKGGTIDVLFATPQIGESPKQDIMNVSGEVATVAPYQTQEEIKKKQSILICPQCGEGVVICADCNHLAKWDSGAIHITDLEKGSYFLCIRNDCYDKFRKE